MKVLIVPSWYLTKANPVSGVFFKEQALALQQSGIDVTIAYPEVRSLQTITIPQEKSGFHYEIEDGIKTYRRRGFNYLPRIKGQVAKKHVNWLENLFDKIVESEGKPDVIHAHSIIWGGWAASQLCRKHNIPLVLTEHSSAFTNNRILSWQKEYVKETLELANKIISVGPSLKESLTKYTNKKISIIPNAVDISRFRSNQKNKSTEKFRFFSLAFLRPIKGMDILLKAFASAFENNADVELVIGGDGEERNNLEQLTQQLGIDEKVIFLGSLTREQVSQHMSECDSFVLASRSETFGVVYIEALASGKPVIATKCGGPEMIVTKENGLLVEVDHIEQLTESLYTMKNNYNDYSSEEIVQDCQNRFSTKAVSKKIIDVYKSVSI